MQVINRTGWGARKPKRPPQQVSPGQREYFVVHHSGAPSTQTVRAIQDWCMNEPPHGRGFADIDYNFLVDQQGLIYEGRGWDAIGAHTVGYNTNGIGVCVIGNDEISDAAMRSVVQLYHAANGRCARTLKIRGHRQLATTGTTCPGNRIFSWLQAGMPLPGTDHPEENTPVDIRLDPRDLDAIVDKVVEKLITVKLTESAAARLGKKAGDTYRLDLLVQRAVIDGVDTKAAVAKLIGEGPA